MWKQLLEHEITRLVILYLSCRPLGPNHPILYDWQDLPLLTSLDIRRVLSLDVDKLDLNKELAQMFVCLSDQPESNLLSKLPLCMDFLSEDRTNVLVHCRHGVSRSATVVIAYLLRLTRGLTVKLALDRLKTIREGVEPNSGFIDQLKLWSVMGCKLDLSCVRYHNFLIQHRQPVVSNIAVTDHKVRCRKCRVILASVTSHVIPHKTGVFPDWRQDYHPHPEVSCRTGLFLVPTSWLDITTLSTGCVPTRLICPSSACGARLGSVGWGVRCNCGATGGGGALLNISKLDVG